MQKPEEHYWSYLAGGFKGLISLIRKGMELCRMHGDKPPESFVSRLKEVRDLLSTLIAELENGNN